MSFSQTLLNLMCSYCHYSSPQQFWIIKNVAFFFNYIIYPPKSLFKTIINTKTTIFVFNDTFSFYSAYQISVFNYISFIYLCSVYISQPCILPQCLWLNLVFLVLYPTNINRPFYNHLFYDKRYSHFSCIPTIYPITSIMAYCPKFYFSHFLLLFPHVSPEYFPGGNYPRGLLLLSKKTSQPVNKPLPC